MCLAPIKLRTVQRLWLIAAWRRKPMGTVNLYMSYTTCFVLANAPKNSWFISIYYNG